jgi:hypothetical protein
MIASDHPLESLKTHHYRVPSATRTRFMYERRPMLDYLAKPICIYLRPSACEH